MKGFFKIKDNPKSPYEKIRSKRKPNAQERIKQKRFPKKYIRFSSKNGLFDIPYYK